MELYNLLFPDLFSVSCLRLSDRRRYKRQAYLSDKCQLRSVCRGEDRQMYGLGFTTGVDGLLARWHAPDAVPLVRHVLFVSGIKAGSVL